MSAGEFDYTVAGPAAWFDPEVFTSNVPGQAAGWFDYDYLEPGLAPTPPPPPKPKPKPVVFPTGSTGGGGGGGAWPLWTVNDSAIRDRRLRDLFERAKIKAPIVKWVKPTVVDDEVDDETKPVIFVENVIDTKTQFVFVPVLIAAPPIVVSTAHIPRWIGWTMIGIGATLITVSLVEIAASKPKRRRRKPRRR